MRILVTNDDGIYSPGIRALARIAQGFGEVFVVAPDVERSGAGHAITHTRPLSFRHTQLDGFDGYRVDGTPADCVAVGLHQYDDIDVVLSGINMGPNLGNSLWHSGTLAAAKQAVLFSRRGIALSTPTDQGDPDFDLLRPFVEQVLELLLSDDALQLVNVNFPPNPQGVCWARQSVRQYDGQIVPGRDPRGKEHFWFTVTPLEDPDEGTDRWAVEHGKVSITPLRLDITHEHALEQARKRHPLDEADHPQNA